MTTFLSLPIPFQVFVGSIVFLFASVIAAVGIVIFCAAANTLAHSVGVIVGYIKGEKRKENETQNMSG